MTGKKYHYRHILQELQKVPDAVHARKRRAGALVRVNLPPLMGMRDAALAGAARILDFCGAAPDHNAVRIAAPEIAGMFQDAAECCARILGKFNNQDTIARETRLFNHVESLAEISAALVDCNSLNARMKSAVQNDAAGDAGFDCDYIRDLDERMRIISAELAGQLYAAFERYHLRVARYRDYAVKNLSPEYAERYRQAYNAASGRYDSVIEKIFKNIQNPKNEE